MGYSIAAPWEKEMDGRTKLHRARYHFGRGYVSSDDRVVDIGCGQGYGVYILAEVAEKVTGIDIEEGDIKYLRENNKLQNVEFIHGNLEEIEIPSCDVLCGFEVVEHLFDPYAFIQKMKKKVTKFICLSVPIAESMILVDGKLQGANDSTHHYSFGSPTELDNMVCDSDWGTFFGFRTGVTYIICYYNKNQ